MLTARDFLRPRDWKETFRPERCFSKPLDKDFWRRLAGLLREPTREQPELAVGLFKDYVSSTPDDEDDQRSRMAEQLACEPFEERRRIAMEFVEIIGDGLEREDIRNEAAQRLHVLCTELALGNDTSVGEALLAIWRREFPPERLQTFREEVSATDFRLPGASLLLELTHALVPYACAEQSRLCVHKAQEALAGVGVGLGWEQALKTIEAKQRRP